MKKSKLFYNLINLFYFQNQINASKRAIKKENFGIESVFKKLWKVLFRRPLGAPKSHSGQKDIIHYITSRNMRKTITPSNFKNILTEPEMNFGNIKYFLQLISHNLKKSKQSMYSPSNVNIFGFQTKNCVLCNLISKESQDNEKQSEENEANNWGGPEAYNAVKILKEDFDEVVSKSPAVLVFFYAYWCRHCQRLKSPFGKAALMGKEHGLNVLFAAFDVTINPDIADAKGVVGIPIIKYYKNGNFVATFRGQRTTEEIFAFAKNPPEPPTDLVSPNI